MVDRRSGGGGGGGRQEHGEEGRRRRRRRRGGTYVPLPASLSLLSESFFRFVAASLVSVSIQSSISTIRATSLQQHHERRATREQRQLHRAPGHDTSRKNVIHRNVTLKRVSLIDRGP
jgi:hypothetical protein